MKHVPIKDITSRLYRRSEEVIESFLGVIWDSIILLLYEFTNINNCQWMFKNDTEPLINSAEIHRETSGDFLGVFPGDIQNQQMYCFCPVFMTKRDNGTRLLNFTHWCQCCISEMWWNVF